MKEIIIKLTDREAFAINRAGIREPSKRKQFGAHGITTKIGEQLITQIGEEAVIALKEEWRAIKSELPAITPKKTPKKIKNRPNMKPLDSSKRINGYIVRD